MEIKFLNGTYRGECENGVPEGTGAYTAENGSVYKGTWAKGELVSGVLHVGDMVYIGEFKKMLPHGKGTEYVSRFRSFTGSFHKGRKTKPQKGWGCHNVIRCGIKEAMWFSRIKAEDLNEESDGYSGRYKEYYYCFPLEKLSETVGFGVLCLNDRYKQAYGYSGNGIASKLSDMDITGNIIICRDNGDGNPVPFASPEEAEAVYDAIWEELFDPDYNYLHRYANAVKIASISAYSSLYLISKKLYAVEHTSKKNDVFDTYEGWQSGRPASAVRVHLLPDGMVDPAEAKAYVDAHNAWSDWAEKDKECNEADTARRAGDELFEKCLYELTTE